MIKDTSLLTINYLHGNRMGRKTLKEMLEESEKLFKETGHYYGLKELELKEKDPFRWMQAYAKLRGALVTAREVAIHVSSSPIVRSIGDSEAGYGRKGEKAYRSFFLTE